jgi:hypothetical protein
MVKPNDHLEYPGIPQNKEYDGSESSNDCSVSRKAGAHDAKRRRTAARNRLWRLPLALSKLSLLQLLRQISLTLLDKHLVEKSRAR